MAIPSWMPIIMYAIALMVYVGVYTLKHIENSNEQKPFAFLVFATAFMLFNDFVSRLYIYPGFPNWLIVLCTYINFAVRPVIGVAWYRFVRSILSAEERRSARRLDFLVYILAGIGMATLLFNEFTGWVFNFDAAGTYHRGSLFFFPAGSTFLCILIAELFMLFRVRSVGRTVLISMLAFPVPPLIGGIVAMFFYGVPWMPLGISLSMIILFANLQNTSLGMDFLTGLYNRRKLDEDLEDRISRAYAGRSFAGLMIDIDDFKEINDNLGHAVGDIALAQTADLLRASVRAGDAVARYGGDEFVVLLDIKDESDVDEVIARIKSAEESYNEQASDFKLYLSIGQCIFRTSEFESAEAFIAQLDKRMYANKLQNKLQRAQQLAG